MQDVDFDVYVILPASGSGERFGSDPPKQYKTILNKPLIFHTLETFHRLRCIKRIVVPVKPEYKSYLEDIVSNQKFHKVVTVVGANSRHRSIYAALQALKPECTDSSVVIIQDVVRVFADSNIIQEVALTARRHGACGVVRPLVSTVISADSDDFLQESLDRSQYRASEMPQGFLYHVIDTAYRKSTDFDFDYGTECLLLAMKYTETKVKLVPGPDNLWKVTYRKDLYAAEGMLKEKHIQVAISGDCSSDVVATICKHCQQRNIQVCSDGNSSGRPNTFVFMYQDVSVDELTTNTETAVSDSGPWESVYTRCILHVCRVKHAASSQATQFMDMCSNLAQRYIDQGVHVYGILDKGCCNVDRLSAMVTKIVWNNDSEFTGQTFTINT